MPNDIPTRTTPSFFNDVRQGMLSHNLKDRTQKSRQWLLQNLKNLKINQNILLKDKDRFVKTIMLGKMYFFNYDPKLKEELPFYDRFPLVICIKKYSDGFLGLNLHYLPIRYRIMFLKKLYSLVNNDHFDESTKFKVTYNLLEGSARFKEFAPCLKRYLTGHIKQKRVINIEPEMWEVALFLPIEKFAKQKASVVQKLSVESIN
jgi:hypothetical protein